MEVQKFKIAASEAELMTKKKRKEKKKNTIVEPWPLRLALKQEDVRAQEEFDLWSSSSCNGVERYV